MIGALVALIVGFGGAAGFLNLPADPGWQEPYGGCKEAYLYPDSVGAAECRAHGL